MNAKTNELILLDRMSVCMSVGDHRTKELQKRKSSAA